MTDGTLRREKQRLRREIREAAGWLTAEYCREASGRIARQAVSLPEYRNARVIMAFVSLSNEPDTRMIIDDAVRAGKTVLLPRCVTRERMEAAPFTGWEKLVPGWMGIPEPPAPEAGADIPEPELILVPCVTVSPEGIRLGHGGGYYDRFLAGRQAETVCLCYQALMREHVPAGPADVRMGRVVTDGGAIDACPDKE